jgi:tetratricopeptide (TPR) repeat protein
MRITAGWRGVRAACRVALVGGGLAALSSACVSTRGATVDAIPRLEAQRASKGGSADVRRSLGIAYFKANRFAEAKTELEEASKLRPRDGVTALYVGLTAEALNDLPAARAAYSNYVQFGRTSRVRRQLDQRLAALQKREIAEAAKSAIARETQLAGVAGNPRTVAVLPFRYNGADTTYKPLERGFAELITTDLSRVPGLTVVERARLQAILDELQLQSSGATDAATSVRTGKLIQAGRMVAGELTLNANQLRASTAIVDVATGIPAGGPPDNSTIDALFDMEKRIVIDLIEKLGFTITTALRNQIEQRPTRSLQAFLAYSRGLVAEDRGQYDEAGRFFQDASRIDPNFAPAQQKSQEVSTIVAGTQVNATTVESGLQGSTEGAVVDAATQGVVTTSSLQTTSALSVAGDLNPSSAANNTGGSTTTTVTPPAGPTAGTGLGATNPALPHAVVTVVIRPPGAP